MSAYEKVPTALLQDYPFFMLKSGVNTEVERYFGQCKFTGCSHTVEKGCAVRAALEAGEIDKTRYESYVTLYNEAKEVKEWQM